jgi:hypothetical protein
MYARICGRAGTRVRKLREETSRTDGPHGLWDGCFAGLRDICAYLRAGGYKGSADYADYADGGCAYFAGSAGLREMGARRDNGMKSEKRAMNNE